MKVLILGGNSKHNHDWIIQLKEHLEDSYSDVYAFEYEHWKTGDEFINFDTELNKLNSFAKDDPDYMIIAKSIGTLLTLKGLDKKILNPKSILFLGVPVALLKDDYSWFWESLKNVKTPLAIAQNQNDPLGAYDQLVNKLDDENIEIDKLVSLPGDTHDYHDLEKIKLLIR